MLLKNHHVLSSNRLDEFQDLMQRRFTSNEFSITQRGHELDASVSAVAIERLGLTEVSYGQNVSLKAVVREEDCCDLLAIIIPTSGTSRLEQNGQCWDSSTNAGLVCDVRHPFVTHMHNASRLMLSCSTQVLKQHLRCLIGDAVDTMELTFDPIIDFSKPEGQILRQSLLYAAQEVDGPLGQLENPIALRGIENFLLTQLVSLQPNSCMSRLRTQDQSKVLPCHVKRARDYIHAHAHEKITLEDITANVSCGYRSLQRAFREAFGLSPMAYLKSVRLRHIRDALMKAEPGAAITPIAAQWGIHHMGRLARDYRQQFGVSPSETLRFKK
ncbi:MAG: helix-turn-helix transcriptional regulator [Planctomycetota bacterium]|jgi:AraC-like DNA-binding protein